MNLDLLYTRGVGNSKSNLCIFLIQIVLYISAVDMTKTFQGLLISLLLALAVSTIFISIFSFYNSENAKDSKEEPYVKDLISKNKIFIRLITESYLVSLALIIVFYLIDICVAKYSIYTSLINFLFVLVLIVAHEKAIYKRYNELRSYKWVFDYSRSPVIATNQNGESIKIPMFNEKNKFLLDYPNNPLDINDLFYKIPPGTKILHGEAVSPKFKIIDFNYEFDYRNINTASEVFLKNENENDVKIKNLYIDVLSKYKDLYHIEINEVKALKSSIKFNNYEFQAYTEKNDYIKKYSISEEKTIFKVSIILKEEYINLTKNRFIKLIGQKVRNYKIERDDEKIYISEVLGANEIKSDISYFKDYMSLNEFEYECPKRTSFENLNFEISSEEEISEIEAHNKFNKTLYRLNIKGELIYIFLEDLDTLSELNELIIKKFINNDIGQAVSIATKDRI